MLLFIILVVDVVKCLPVFSISWYQFHLDLNPHPLDYGSMALPLTTLNTLMLMIIIPFLNVIEHLSVFIFSQCLYLNPKTLDYVLICSTTENWKYSNANAYYSISQCYRTFTCICFLSVSSVAVFEP